MNHQYRDYRHRLHKDYYYKYNNNEMRLKNNPLMGMNEDNWAMLIRYFGSEEFKLLTSLIHFQCTIYMFVASNITTRKYIIFT